MPLRILKSFRAEQEWVLEAGDMLYLPPRYAHDGVAIDECFTYSVGFRAPSPQEWLSEFLMDQAERLELPGHYADPQLRVQKHSGALPRTLQKFFQTELGRLRFDAHAVRDFHGRYLTDPKPHVFFPAPQAEFTPAGFRRAALALGVRLDPRSRLLFAGDDCWCNGEHFPMAPEEQRALIALADCRQLDALDLQTGDRSAGVGWRGTLWPMLHQWFEDGWLRLLPGP
jgi:50S ribosomal protein L16 3-hydroxylase